MIELFLRDGACSVQRLQPATAILTVSRLLPVRLEESEGDYVRPNDNPSAPYLKESKQVTW